MSGVAPVGRDDLLAGACARLSRQESVVITGPAGAGKSTVIAALAARAEAAGAAVLRAAPAESEAGLPYLTLVDLLAGIDDGHPAWRELGATGWEALAAVRDGAAVPGDRELAVRLAVLRLLRGLAAGPPVLLVVDDAQWMDAASAGVLGFVARRIGDHRVHALLAERIEPPATAAADTQLCPPPVHALPLPPLTPPDLAELLRVHTGSAPAPSTLARIHATSAGNPLYALEIARALERAPPPGEPLPVPDRLRDLMGERLRRLSRPVRRTLLLVSAAARPTEALLRRVAGGRAASDLATAARRGVVETGAGGVIRFTHPLLSAALYTDAPAAQRRAAHSRLAEVVTDPIERARHRALAVTGPDEALARSLIRASHAARTRGAPGAAAELALVAAERTPGQAAATRRLLHAATAALAAGRCEQARHTAESVLAVATSRRLRVRAWLVVLDAASQALARTDLLFVQALRDAGPEPGLQAPIRIRSVAKALMEGKPDQALAEARRCCALAAEAGDHPTLLQALCMEATAALTTGRPEPEVDRSIARALDLADLVPDAPTYQGPRHLLARHHLNRDRFEAARTGLLPLLARAEQQGRVEDLAGLLRNLAEVELQAGRCAAARDAAYRALALVEDADLSAGPCLSLAARAEATGGDPTRARALAARGVELSEADGDRFFLPRNLHALGYAALVAGDVAAAADALHRVVELEATMGELDPALFRWHADAAEALVAAGQLDAAAGVIARARRAAARRARDTVLATLDRAEALRRLADRDPAGAVGLLRAAAGRLPTLPLERARTLHALGVAERRRRRRAAAQAAFQEAVGLFAHAGAAPWAARARSELAAAAAPGGGDGSPPDGGLTGTEHRVARLVTGGATNQQVAAALSVSVKTVESYLTRIYRKLRIRSRAELAGSFARSDGVHPEVKGFP